MGILTETRTRDDLRTYQLFGIDLAITKPSVALMLGVGTGKTAVGLTAAWVRMYHNFDCHGVLVVGPKRVIQTVWRQEAARWDHLKDLRFTEIKATSKRERQDPVTKRWFGKRIVTGLTYEENSDIYLINYENLEQMADWYIQTKNRPPFNMVIYDELSKMANHTAGRSKAMLRLMRKVGGIHYRLGMTGTPATNGLQKLFGEYHALDSGQRLGTSKTGFLQSMFIPVGQGYKWVPRHGTKDAILKRTADITFYADRREELNLPPVTIEDRWVDMPSTVKDQYKELETNFFLQLGEEEIEVFNAAALSNKCLQFASGTVYTRSNDHSSAAPVHEAKLDALEQLVDELDDEPLLVCYQYRMEEARLRKRFPFAKSVNDYKDASVIVDQWSEGKVKMLIGHPASMGHGLNLQHGGCNMAWFGLNWDLELYEQAIGRLDRMGQERPVMVFRFLTTNTLEDAVRVSLAEKFDTQADYLSAIRNYQQRLAAH